MKKYTTSLMILLALALNVQAQDATKFLTVDFQAVFQSYKKANDDIAMLRSSSESTQAQIDEMFEQYKTMVLDLRELVNEECAEQGLDTKECSESIERINNPAFTNNFSAELIAKYDGVQEKEKDIRTYQEEARQNINKNERDILNKHFVSIRDVVAEIAQERGVEIVFNSGVTNNNIIYAVESADITEEVIAKMNADSEGNSGE